MIAAILAYLRDFAAAIRAHDIAACGDEPGDDDDESGEDDDGKVFQSLRNANEN